MSRYLDDAEDEYLHVGSAVVSGTPVTMACWVYIDEEIDTFEHLAMTISDADGSPYLELLGIQLSGNNRVRANTSGIAQAEATAFYSINTWHHFCGIFASDTDRRAFLDGGNKGTDTTSVSVSGLDTTRLGALAFFSIDLIYFSGRICEAAVWNAALTDDEVAILGDGFSPLFVRPQAIAAYWPLIRDEDQDRVGGFDLTAFNTPTVASHVDKIIYPAPPFISYPAAAVAAGQPTQVRTRGIPTGSGYRDRVQSWNAPVRIAT